MFCDDFILSPEKVKKINENRRALGINGMPIGFWIGNCKLPRDAEHFTPDCVDLWKDCGFTMGQTPYFNAFDEESVEIVKKILVRAGELGIKVILIPEFDRWADRALVDAEYGKIMEKLYSDFKDYPAVFGVFVVDEPHSPERHALATYMMNMQRRIAPTWTPFLNLLPYWEPHGVDLCWEYQGFDCFSASLDDFVKEGKCEYLSYDLYHPMKPGVQGWTNHFNCLRYYREAALRHNIPFINHLLSVGHFNYRCPTYDDLRWQVMSSIACGVSGFAWYYLYQGVHLINYRHAPLDELWEKSQSYYDIRKIHREIHATYGNLFEKIVCYRVEFAGQSFGTDPSFRPSPIVMGIAPDKMHHPLLVSYFVDEEGDKYLMIVNNTTEHDGSTLVTVTFDKKADIYHIDHGEAGKANYICDNHIIQDDVQLCKYWLAPGQEVLIKVVSDEARNYPAYVPPMMR